MPPGARDDEVRDMISPLVQRLHYFRRLSRHSGAADGLKAYRFEVDATDDPWIMNPEMSTGQPVYGCVTGPIHCEDNSTSFLHSGRPSSPIPSEAHLECRR